MKFKLTKNKAFRLLGILFVFIGIFLFVGDRFDFADPTQGNDISENIVNNVSNIEETSQEIENNDEADESLETEDSTTSKTKDENLTSEKEKADVKEGEEKEETATEKKSKAKKDTIKDTANSSADKKSTSSKPTQSNSSNEMAINPETGKDQYQTEPVPKDKPKPVEPEESKKTDKKKTATLSVSAENVLKNLDQVSPEIRSLLPKNGIIFTAQKVTFQEGESVFDVLQREMRHAGIHMESSFTPMYNSAYVEGINNLYEFDGGSLSGWMYKVNGWFPNYGASRYQLENGDVIEWVYTFDLGRDVGDNYYD